MSVTVRLAKFGKRHQPSYRIVVANTRDKRNGKFLDTLGHYNPSETPERFEIDKEKYEDWLSKGALVTNAVKDLVAGNYEFRPYDPNAKTEEEEKDSVETEEKTEESASENEEEPTV